DRLWRRHVDHSAGRHFERAARLSDRRHVHRDRHRDRYEWSDRIGIDGHRRWRCGAGFVHGHAVESNARPGGAVRRLGVHIVERDHLVLVEFRRWNDGEWCNDTAYLLHVVDAGNLYRHVDDHRQRWSVGNNLADNHRSVANRCAGFLTDPARVQEGGT